MEPLSNNFTLTEKSSTSILLKFWGYFWLQDFRGSKKGSIYVCRNLPMSHLVQFKAWKWGFGWFLNLQAWKTWIFQISRVAHRVWWILGAPIWAPKSQKFYFHKLQKKLKIFQFYHVYSKCTSFDVQLQIPKCNQIPYYVKTCFYIGKSVTPSLLIWPDVRLVKLLIYVSLNLLLTSFDLNICTKQACWFWNLANSF